MDIGGSETNLCNVIVERCHAELNHRVARPLGDAQSHSYLLLCTAATQNAAANKWTDIEDGTLVPNEELYEFQQSGSSGATERISFS